MQKYAKIIPTDVLKNVKKKKNRNKEKGIQLIKF